MNMLRCSIVTQPKNGLQYFTNIDVLVSLLDPIPTIHVCQFEASQEDMDWPSPAVRKTTSHQTVLISKTRSLQLAQLACLHFADFSSNLQTPDQ